jgi:hypothetical protein
MNVKWTPALLDAVRARAKAGDTMRRAASLLNVPVSSLESQASAHQIHFHGQSGRVSTAISRLEARMAHAREIAQAVRERATAPDYKP